MAAERTVDNSGESAAPSAATGPIVQPSEVDQKTLDEIFGDVLPDITDDERDPGSGDGHYSDQWYRENRPPHHGG